MIAWLAVAALTFPDIQARDLDGRAVAGRDLDGHAEAVLLGFSYQSRHDVEAWAKVLGPATQGELPVILMPVYPGIPGFVRVWVDGRMARETPPERRRFCWTTTDRGALLAGLGLDASAGVVAVLLDPSRHVVCLERGTPTPGNTATFLRAWQAMQAGHPNP